MPLFKKKVKVQVFAEGLVVEAVPRAIEFFHKENKRAHFHVNLAEDDLVYIGSGLCLFFLAERIKAAKKADVSLLQRATKGIRRGVSQLGLQADRAQDWWKTIDDDARIVHVDMETLEVACRAVWNRKYSDRPFKDHGPIRSFAYMLKVDVDALDKIKLV